MHIAASPPSSAQQLFPSGGFDLHNLWATVLLRGPFFPGRFDERDETPLESGVRAFPACVARGGQIRSESALCWMRAAYSWLTISRSAA